MFELEMKLVVNTVASAILNPSKWFILMLNILQHLIIHNVGFTKWDLSRFAEVVKGSKFEGDASSNEDINLARFFHEPKFGDLTEPTTILDREGKVMAWALPGVLHPNRLVRLST
jgi:hypothetical protein